MKKHTFIIGLSSIFALSLFAQTVNDGDLIASLHLNQTVDVVGVDVADNLAVRTSNGNPNTRGVLSGSVDFLASQTVDPGDYVGAALRGFSGISFFVDMNRFAGNPSGGGVAAWDYDFSSITNTASGYRFQVDYTAESTASGSRAFYVSYNDGVSLSLDTTDIAGETANRGAGGLVVDNTDAYELLASFDVSQAGTTGVYEIDVDMTNIVQTAIANGGGIRIALVENTFKNNLRFYNATGIVSAIPEPGSFALLAGLFTLARVALHRRNRYA